MEAWRRRLEIARLAEEVLAKARRTGSDRAVGLAEVVHAAEEARLAVEEATLLWRETGSEAAAAALADARAGLTEAEARLAEVLQEEATRLEAFHVVHATRGGEDGA